MKTIGVIGGLGPQATMDFERRVHRIAQRMIQPRFNSGYPPMIVIYHRRPPVLLNEDNTPRRPITPDPGLLEAARAIGAAAGVIVGVVVGFYSIAEAIGTPVIAATMPIPKIALLPLLIGLHPFGVFLSWVIAAALSVSVVSGLIFGVLLRGRGAATGDP
ncbi:MAG: hypothetical protein ACREIB_14785, partial [Pseudomonadota bacterium]